MTAVSRRTFLHTTTARQPPFAPRATFQPGSGSSAGVRDDHSPA